MANTDGEPIPEPSEEVLPLPQIDLPTRPPRVRYFWVSEPQLNLLKVEAKSHAERLGVMSSAFSFALSTGITVLTTRDALVTPHPNVLNFLYIVLIVSVVVSCGASVAWFRNRKAVGTTLEEIRQQHPTE